MWYNTWYVPGIRGATAAAAVSLAFDHSRGAVIVCRCVERFVYSNTMYQPYDTCDVTGSLRQSY